MADDELPYTVEYAKSGRSSCKHCKESIPKDKLRMGIMIQSPRFDGRIPIWYHFHCFFAKKTLTSTSDIHHFDNLRFEDQKKIQDKLGAPAGEASTNGKKKTKKSKAQAAVKKDPTLAEFQIEYAKSSKSSCKVCTEKITKNEVRISKLDRESEAALRFGPCPGWHHVDCFVEEREELGFMEEGDKLPGFDKLNDEDKAMIKEKIKVVKDKGKRKAEPKKEAAAATPPPPKKSKKEADLEEKLLEAQSKLIYGYRDKLQESLTKKELQTLLESNSQEIAIPGESALLDAVADALAFGALKPCPECGGQLRFGTNAYKCAGYLTGWTKCLYNTKKPDRKAFVVPKDFKEEYDFLKKYKYVPRDRLIPERSAPSTQASSSKKGKPLKGFKIAIIGDLHQGKEAVEEVISKSGGKIVDKIDKNTTCIISNKDGAEKHKKKIKSAQNHSIFVVSEEFLNDIVAMHDNAMVPLLMKKYMMFSWGKDPSESLPESVLKSSKVSSGISSQKLKLAVGGKAAVDPASGLEDSHHVVEQNGSVYNAVLAKVNVTRGKNAYYKLQLLKSNSSKSYVVFRAWGRVGTTIGDTRMVTFNSLNEAIQHFEEIYFLQTENHWSNRDNFVKQPACYYPLDIDYGADQSEKMQVLKPCKSSKLAEPIQELICMIFDVEAMKKAMLEFEIDLKKMPLGKLSKKQIQSAYAILGEVQNILKGDKNETKILDASNRFYTLIPHDFGMNKPTLLDNDVILQMKTEMLESLLDIECAYHMLQESHGDADAIDQHYEQLKTDIEIVDKDSKEFERIETYVQNTHAPTHSQYKLDIEQVFKICRHGESDRYQKFKDLHNKKLLWHGSRKTNYAGILSQGLRIAPPEAPVTGYMFGKGVYFADMVSKSANYCFTNQRNPVGLLLLCEVALGNMYERTNAEFVQKLPKDKHSTKGLGQTEPNPKETVVDNGVEIPLGQPIQSTKDRRSLLYNEYIVYDVNQVNIKYLLQVKFNWK